MPPVIKDTPRSSARKRKQVSYKEIEDEAGFDIVKSLVSNDDQQQVIEEAKQGIKEANRVLNRVLRKRKWKSNEDEVVSKKVATSAESGTKCLLCASEIEGGMKEARFHYTICLLNEGSFSLLEEYREKGNAEDRAFECLFSGDGCTKKKYNHRNFCIHMATSHGFDSVAQIMAR